MTDATRSTAAAVACAQWHEIDVAARLWTVPANRTKRQREHRVPLCKATVAVLERVAAVRQSKCVFAGDREGEPLSPMALLIALRRMRGGVAAPSPARREIEIPLSTPRDALASQM